MGSRTFEWPAGFARVPPEEWTHQPVETLALKYDTVENHGWYKNLDPTVAQLEEYLRNDQILVDYSGGTGILADRLLHRIGDRRIGVIIVDASPKFLRLALEKFQNDERLAFRWIRYLKDRKRLQFVDEVVDSPLVSRGVEAVVSTNAIHLYYDLQDTLKSWVRILKPRARAFVQSGNIRNPDAKPGEWIIDETVEAIHRTAVDIVRSESRFAPYRSVLEDPRRMEEYESLRNKYFLPVRALDYYLTSLRKAGFEPLEVTTSTIEARVDEWYKFLSVYHEGVLGWVGGAEKIEGRAPAKPAVRDRLEIMRLAMERLFLQKSSFDCCWTYITCDR